MIDWSKIQQAEPVTAMIDVKVAPKRGVGFDEVAERIYRFPEVKALYLMSGAYDLQVVIEGKTMHEIARFVSARINALIPLDADHNVTIIPIDNKPPRGSLMVSRIMVVMTSAIA